jgi:hypothetical protein
MFGGDAGNPGVQCTPENKKKHRKVHSKVYFSQMHTMEKTNIW